MEPRHARSYADGKPCPLMRGVIHAICSICMVVSAGVQSDTILSIALLCKAATYTASAFFHMYSFETIQKLIWAFRVDLLFVPFAGYGHLVPFSASDQLYQLQIFVAVLALNTLLVWWQTEGQHLDLQTPPHKTDTPRIAIIATYAIWSMYRVGASTGYCAAWRVCPILWPPAVFLASRVSAEHYREPTARWARWHVPHVWSFHEDLHLLVAITDVAWLFSLSHAIH